MSYVDTDRILYSIEAARNLAAGGKPGLDCAGVCWNVGLRDLDSDTARKAREVALELCKTRHPLVPWCSAACPLPGGIDVYELQQTTATLWSGESRYLRRLYASCLADALGIIYAEY